MKIYEYLWKLLHRAKQWSRILRTSAILEIRFVTWSLDSQVDVQAAMMALQPSDLEATTLGLRD